MDANRLVGVTLWRVFVAALAWYGFDQITDASRLLPWALPPWWMLGELSQLASLLVVVGYLLLAAYPLVVNGRPHEPYVFDRASLDVLLRDLLRTNQSTVD